VRYKENKATYSKPRRKRGRDKEMKKDMEIEKESYRDI
jgi:hypothetical protein